MGRATAARMKEQKKFRRPNVRVRLAVPHAEIGLPSAPTRDGPDGGGSGPLLKDADCSAGVDEEVSAGAGILQVDQAAESVDLLPAAT
jgi:hypothetical protein